ncbi:MAG: kinase [Dehalococcoidia bacterium]|jgi:predicted kinase|nr:MAG: kinase [Dehalococcoidia bacterium]
MLPAPRAFARSLRPGRPLVVLLSGLPGSGKSTWARRYAACVGADHVETDRLRRSIFPVRTYSPDEHAVVYRAAFAAIRRAIERGRHVVFDATNLDEEARAPVRKLCDELDAGLAIVQFDTEHEEILRRLLRRATDPDPDDQSEAGPSVYEALRTSLRPVCGPHWRVRDPAEAEQVLQEIVALVRKAGACASG